MSPLKRPEALWLGRFQPPTITHMANVKLILEMWQKLTIGVVYGTARPPNIDSRWDDFLRQTTTITLVSWKNPFLSDEVIRMWEAGLEKAGYHDRVNLFAMPQVAHQTDFNVRFPPSRMDFVEVDFGEAALEIDRRRSEVFQNLLDRKIWGIKAPFILHNTEIRHRVLNGGQSWEEFLPEGTYEVFLEIKGPERIAHSS